MRRGGFCRKLFPRTREWGSFLNLLCFPGARGSGEARRLWWRRPGWMAGTGDRARCCKRFFGWHCPLNAKSMSLFRLALRQDPGGLPDSERTPSDRGILRPVSATTAAMRPFRWHQASWDSAAEQPPAWALLPRHSLGETRVAKPQVSAPGRSV